MSTSASQSSSATECAVCAIAASLSCGGCKKVYYCGKDHQKLHWKEHKISCSFKKKEKPATSAAEPLMGFSASSWSRGKFASEDKMYEWLVDCYRLRMDDMMCWGGNYLSIYNPDASKDDVIGDFITFALFCIKKKALPVPWNWSKFLKIALQLIPYAFEKSDATDKYPGAFSAMTLRGTAEMIYGKSLGDSDFTEYNEMHDLIFKTNNCLSNKSIFKDIGGIEIWESFKNNLQYEGGEDFDDEDYEDDDDVEEVN